MGGRRKDEQDGDEPGRHSASHGSGSPIPRQPGLELACKPARRKADHRQELQPAQRSSLDWRSLSAKQRFAMARHLSSNDFYATLPACLRQLGFGKAVLEKKRRQSPCPCESFSTTTFPAKERYT